MSSQQRTQTFKLSDKISIMSDRRQHIISHIETHQFLEPYNIYTGVQETTKVFYKLDGNSRTYEAHELYLEGEI